MGRRESALAYERFQQVWQGRKQMKDGNWVNKYRKMQPKVTVKEKGKIVGIFYPEET